MIEYVFKQSRRVKGKRVVARSFSGRYSLKPGEPVVTVALYTTDKKVAEKRLRDLVVVKQYEAEGISIPEALRSAASAALASLISEYRADLSGRGLEVRHVHSTILRIQRMAGAAGWLRLGDVTASSFVAWRSGFEGAAKTKKEYQTSVNAFLNWLVRMGKMVVNPLARVDRVDIRGKQVRKSRAFTQAEIAALCRVVPADRRLVYLFLTYTGARKSEAKAVRWSDLELGKNPSVVLRVTKDKDKRTIPLRPELAKLLDEARLDLGERVAAFSLVKSSGRVFETFPSWETLLLDFKRAGIVRCDVDGRLVHFHAFRKTFQMWGALAGVGQRAAQEMLGHSDPALTANVYTDVAGLGLHGEISKLPWVLESHTKPLTKSESSCVSGAFRAVLAQLVELAKVAICEGDKPGSEFFKVVVGDGFEPSKA